MRSDLDRDLEDEGVASTTPGVVYQDLLIITSRTDEGPRKAAQDTSEHTIAAPARALDLPHHPAPRRVRLRDLVEGLLKTAGGANNWGGMSVDHDRGLVFVSTGSPTFDFWGGERIGENLFGNCVLCLNAETGERVWHFQTVHHDLFDYDLACAPNLVTVMHNGRPRDAVAQVGKTGWVYLLDRETGEPLYPIEERPVPQSTVPGEQAWPTQPFVTEPPAFSRQYFGPGEIADLSEESHSYLINKRLEDVVLARMFTPPMLDKEVVVFPGYHGGAIWGGASWRQDAGTLFINHNEIPWSLKLVKAKEGSGYPYEHTGYLRPEDEDGYPAIKPPWGRITAMDLNERRILWQFRWANTTNSPKPGTSLRELTTGEATSPRRATCCLVRGRKTASFERSTRRTGESCGTTPWGESAWPLQPPTKSTVGNSL